MRLSLTARARLYQREQKALEKRLWFKGRFSHCLEQVHIDLPSVTYILTNTFQKNSLNERPSSFLVCRYEDFGSFETCIWSPRLGLGNREKVPKVVQRIGQLNNNAVLTPIGVM